VAYEDALFNLYENAVPKEIELYTPYLRDCQFVSFYIGGGTPTVNLSGLLRILQHLKTNYSLSCDICIELHPGDMEADCLAQLKDAGVTMLSVGIESTSDRILQNIGRSHDGKTALHSLRREVCPVVQRGGPGIKYTKLCASDDRYEENDTLSKSYSLVHLTPCGALRRA
jgi:menaquinone C8-methyltransferase